jgi:uncharacterized membrane protein (UPF0127 family)
MRVRALTLALALLLPLAACRGAEQSAPGQAATAESGLQLVPLEIRSGAKVHKFTVEVARSRDEQAQGLMFRESLAPDRGMLFPYSPPEVAGFWMKNTLIPLDMIFVREDGSIAMIADNTIPGSLESVSAGEPVAAVLEIAGGRSAELGITDADKVSWPGGPK